MCECATTYSGRICEQHEAPSICKPNPCQNGGICHDLVGKYDCECDIRFTGPHCQVDKCANCDPNARCVNGRCKCKPGFTGNGYECIKDASLNNCGEFQSSACVGCPCECNAGYTPVESSNGELQSKVCVPLPPAFPPTEEPKTATTTVATTAPPQTTTTQTTTAEPAKPQQNHNNDNKEPQKEEGPEPANMPQKSKKFAPKTPLIRSQQRRNREKEKILKKAIKAINAIKAIKDIRARESKGFNASNRTGTRAEIQSVLTNPRPRDLSFFTHLPTHNSFYRRQSMRVRRPQYLKKGYEGTELAYKKDHI